MTSETWLLITCGVLMVCNLAMHVINTKVRKQRDEALDVAEIACSTATKYAAAYRMAMFQMHGPMFEIAQSSTHFGQHTTTQLSEKIH